MSSQAYIEHVALRVRDLDWYVAFFGSVFDMPVRQTRDDDEAPRQVWLHGGLQLIEDASATYPESGFAHLGLMCDDLDAALAACQQWPLKTLPAGPNWLTLPAGPNWLTLPDGLIIELLPASPGAVGAARRVDPRANAAG